MRQSGLHHRYGELFARGLKRDGVVAASVGAIKTHHAARRVNNVVVEVYTMAFAGFLTAAAVGAQVGVDVKLKHGIATHASQYYPDRADGVTYRAPP